MSSMSHEQHEHDINNYVTHTARDHSVERKYEKRSEISEKTALSIYVVFHKFFFLTFLKSQRYRQSV